MNTLYQRTVEKIDIAGNSLGWETVPVVFPDTFFLYSGLDYNWTDNTVTRNGKTYYLDKLVVNQEMNIPTTDEWQSHYGNDIKFEYYTGDASESDKNPSGNTNNIKRAIYLSSGIIKYILEYDYNNNNKVIKIASIAPQDSIASGDEQQQEEQIEDDTEQDLNNLKFAIGKELIVTDRNTPVIRTNEFCIMVTRRRTNNPLLSDCLQPTENTGKITVSLTSQLYDLECVAYSERNEVLYQSGRVEPTIGSATSVTILNNNTAPIAYVAINLHYKDEEMGIDQMTVNQTDLGLTVAFVASVNLVINLADGSTPIVRKYMSGDTVQFQGLPPTSRQGYDFDGWFINNNQITSNFIITESATIEARWTRLYTLTIINNGAQSSQTYRDGTSITLDTPTKDGYTFIGWFAEGSASAHATTFNISEDLTLTAQYSVNTYSLTLVVDGVETSETYDYGTTVNLTTPEKENYNFVGWFAEGAETTTASPITITGNITLTARFEIIQYTVTLVNVDGRGLNTEDTITCDSGYSLSESEVKDKVDESLTAFVGCYTDSDYTNAISFPYTVIGNVNLYCKFEEIGG